MNYLISIKNSSFDLSTLKCYTNQHMSGFRDIVRKDVISWALYDFANTIYSMNILSLYFAGWLIVDMGYKDIYYSAAYSVSMLASAILMPAFGYFSDRPSRSSNKTPQKKLILLAVFTFGAVISVFAFSLTPVSAIFLILFFFMLSNFFFEGGIVFYNALLDSVSNSGNVGKVSGFGVALGYLGSIVGMILVLPFVTGSLFGLDIPFMSAGGKSAAFMPTAIYFAIFAIPIFLFVREKPRSGFINNNNSIGDPGLLTAYKNVWKSLTSTKKYPGLLRFLISDYFFEDAIATVIIFMAVFIDRVLGMGDSEKAIFMIISTVFATIGAYIFGLMADRIHPRKVLSFIVGGWIITLVVFSVNSIPAIFWISGPIVGVLLGGVWAVSRPLLILLSPREKLGEFFGLFSISGRAAAICGPMVWGAVVYLFSQDFFIGQVIAESFELSDAAATKLPYRLAVLSLAVMMAFGLYIFRKVPLAERKNDA
ncbi:MAG: MFS transporter [candidate division Zixibacteria bacterium]